MSIRKNAFGEYDIYTIENASGAYVRVTDLGATVQSIAVFDRNGSLTDVVLGYDTPSEYLDHDGYFGAFVGRYANRISNASFALGGREYRITANEGKNTLHGGTGLSKRRFAVTQAGDSGLTFCITDSDGADGFPGNVNIRVTYDFSEDNELCICYEAETDADTYLNLTNHSYFNLAGKGDILGHDLMINAEGYLPVDKELIPTGKVRPVAATEFDFRKTRRIENGFFDHCYVLNGKQPCAYLASAESGIVMTVSTDMPAVQFYVGGAIGARTGKRGAVYGKNSALCLETQYYPDSPNRPEFPSALLRAGEKYFSKTSFKFSII